MASETLKEFLVGLGFKVDDDSYRKFTGAVSGATKSVLSLGAELVGATAAIEAMAIEVARRMQDLYYAAQRSGVAVEALQNVGFAAKQLGLDAAKGQDLYEGFARAVRYNPGVQSLAASLGGQFQTVNGQIGLTSQGLDNIIERLATMPRYEAMLYAPMLGFNPETLNRILQNPTLFEQQQRRNAELMEEFGYDATVAAQRGTEFSQSISTLGSEFGYLKDRVFSDLDPAMTTVTDDLASLLEKFGELNDKAGGVPAILIAIASALGTMAGAFGLLGKSTGLRLLLALATKFGGLFSALGLTGLAYGLYEAVKPTPLNEGEEAYMRAHPEIYHLPPEKPKAERGLWSRFKNWVKATTGIEVHHEPTPTTATLTGTSRQAQAIRYFESQGMTPAQAIGMVGNLEGEDATLDPAITNRGAVGIAQWRGPRLAALKAFAEKVGRPYTDFMTQLEFISHELETSEPYALYRLRRAQTPEEAASYASTYYERAPGGYAEAARRGQIAHRIEQSINQTNNITVTGVSEPDRAARIIRDNQTGTVDQMTRIFTSQIR